MKKAIVIGATSGIGRELAKILAGLMAVAWKYFRELMFTPRKPTVEA
jgi:hypothetical protein